LPAGGESKVSSVETHGAQRKAAILALNLIRFPTELFDLSRQTIDSNSTSLHPTTSTFSLQHNTSWFSDLSQNLPLTQSAILWPSQQIPSSFYLYSSSTGPISAFQDGGRT
jgi:hypothetical protein